MKQKLKILCIDDDVTILALLEARLGKKDGHDVIVATEGDEGIRMARKFLPDIILIDWNMPTMTGIEILKALRSNPRTTWIPRYMLTGKTSMGDVEIAAKAGAEGYFTKPLKLDSISQRLETLLPA